MTGDRSRLKFTVYRDDALKEATYDADLIVEATHEEFRDDLRRLTLLLKDGATHVHLVMPKTAIFVCETVANRGR